MSQASALKPSAGANDALAILVATRIAAGTTLFVGLPLTIMGGAHLRGRRP